MHPSNPAEFRLQADPVDQFQLFGGEIGIFRCLDVVQHLLGPGSACQDAGHDAIPQNPSQRHLSQGLTTVRCQVIQPADLIQPLFGKGIFLQEPAIGPDPAVGRNTLQILSPFLP